MNASNPLPPTSGVEVKAQANRYIRQTTLGNFGPQAQAKLMQAKVLVVGAGGLGVPVLQYLTGMGVGTIGIADADKISLSNLHRQVAYKENQVGQYKVESLIATLSQLNSQVIFNAHNDYLTPANALHILPAYDVVVDATDNFAVRYLLNDACVLSGKPCVYGAVQQYEGHVSVFNYQGGPTYRDLYPKQPTAAEIPDCNTAGVLGVAPGIVGCQQALQVVKLITGVGKTLSGYLMVCDFLNDEQYKIKLKAKPENKQVTALQATYDIAACQTVELLSIDVLHNWYTNGKDFTIIDVREPNEYGDGYLQNAVLVPFSTFNSASITAPGYKPLVLFCQKGARSNKAAQALQQQYPSATVYSVVGGMDYWLDEFDDEFLVTVT